MVSRSFHLFLETNTEELIEGLENRFVSNLKSRMEPEDSWLKESQILLKIFDLIKDANYLVRMNYLPAKAAADQPIVRSLLESA